MRACLNICESCSVLFVFFSDISEKVVGCINLGVNDASSILFVIVPPAPGKAGNIFLFSYNTFPFFIII